MEAVEETLTYRDDSGLNRKLLPDKHMCRHEIKNDESNYVDLGNFIYMKSDGTETVKVSYTGEGNQLAVKCDNGMSNEKNLSNCKIDDSEMDIISHDFIEDRLKDKLGARPDSMEPLLEKLMTKDPNTNVDLENVKLLHGEHEQSDSNENVCSESEELQYTDMYFNSKSASDDGASTVVSDHCEYETVEDESHYITTHEIQLTELDHDVDYEVGQGTWDFEDDNLVYSFVDYASFESDETQEGTLILEGIRQAHGKSTKAQAKITHQPTVESDLCDSDKCASSYESPCKIQSNKVNSAGQIHLSIKTSSRAVRECDSMIENDSICGHTKQLGSRSNLFFSSTDARSESLRDRAHYFIPAPGRQHLPTKLKGKYINEYSSGASSSISELDDADKEVRNLTAKSFRSLACPYFDAINLSTSSESPVSECGLGGLNKWSAYVDLNHANLGQRRDVIAQKSSRATVELSKTIGPNNRKGRFINCTNGPHDKIFAVKDNTSSKQSSTSAKNIEIKGQFKPKQGDLIKLRETLDFCCDVDDGVPEGARHRKCHRNGHGSRFREGVTTTALTKSGCEVQCQHTDAGDAMADTHKRAIFASSLLKNVISKKMQFETERKMERGELRDLHCTDACFHCKEQEMMRSKCLGKGLHRQTSESSSAFTANSLDEGDPKEDRKGGDILDNSDVTEKGSNKRNEAGDPPKGQLSRSENSAFKSLREGEPEAIAEAETPMGVSDTPTTNVQSDAMLTKLSHLFVPSSQLLSKENNSEEGLLSSTVAITHTVSEKYDDELNMDKNNHEVAKEGYNKWVKKPEIKIRLRSVKENKGYTLNIANLLTPKISFNTVRTAGNTRCQVLSASEKGPTFTVRDIRDNKCKFQTPIYHVRDVRKLVKSSYHFVSSDNADSKWPTGTSAPADQHVDSRKEDPAKHILPSPIVIQCHSVKTNGHGQNPTATSEALPKQNQAEACQSSPCASSEAPKCEVTSTHRSTSRVTSVSARQLHPDQSDHQQRIESKLLKQRQEKFSGDTGVRRNEPKQDALEKLKAAVKTMEQLYVFDRNEWKRKTQAPRPITDSHVLSLITSEEPGTEAGSRLANSERNIDRLSQTWVNTCQENRGAQDIINVSCTQSQPGKLFCNQEVLHFGNSNKVPVSISSLNNDVPQSSLLQMPSTMKSPISNTQVAPLSLKIAAQTHGQVDQGKIKGNTNTSTVSALASSDSENYLTIPGLGYTSEIDRHNREQIAPSIVSKEDYSNVSQANTCATTNPEQDLKRDAFVMETPIASIYQHSPALQGSQSQVFCISPSDPALSPSLSRGEALPQTQRKMLLDPITGHYYLVDTPIHAPTKRLFDPETGQYVDVPMPHSPVAPVTPAPMSVSPLALSPGVYGPTYMIYPGFIPSPTLHSQTACHIGVEDPRGEQRKHAVQEANSVGSESPYYSATGEVAQVPVQIPGILGHVTRTGGATSDRKPVISITTPQGPRIIAPPSFDGTTMSFVVEHR